MKNLKICLTAFALILSTIVLAQERGRERREQVKSMKVAYITNELQLTPDESAKFWPIYNAFEEKQRELHRMRIADGKDASGFDKMSDKEANAALAQMEKSEEDLYELRKKFIQNLRTALPAQKILKLKRAEEDFNRDLLRQYRGRNKR